jgi:hypothetical protein
MKKVFVFLSLRRYLSNELIMAKEITLPAPATPESIWALLRKLAESQAETDRQMKETERVLNEKFIETDRRIDKVNKTLGSWADNQGSFAEEYFFNSFEQEKQNFFGEKFDEIKKNLKGIETNDEFDIVMLNGNSVGLVEVKYKAHENDIPNVLKKADTFRINFSKYKNHKVYLGLATMAFYPQLEEVCINNGIAVIKQVGNTVVINDEHLKAF